MHHMTSDPHNITDPPPLGLEKSQLAELGTAHEALLALEAEIKAWSDWIGRALDSTVPATEQRAAIFAAARAGRAARAVVDILRTSGDLDKALRVTRAACQLGSSEEARAEIHGPSDLGPPVVEPEA